MSAIARRSSSSVAASWQSNATPFPSATSGWRTPPWKNGLPPRSARNEKTERTAPRPAAAPCRDCDHRARGRGRAGAQLLSLVSIIFGWLMARERLYLFDTTLRDGAQTNGVDFTLNDKLAIARMLDDIGIDYVEGGYPGANPTDTELFGHDRALDTTFTAFGMTRRPGRSTSNDPGLKALLDAKADAICFVAKSWDYHVRVALETTLEENLASIRD